MNLKINNINDFSKFMKMYRLDEGTSLKEMKSFVRTYLKNYLIAQIKDMVIQDFTLSMMFKSITKNDKTLASYLNLNTFKSWVRKNIHKDALKAQTTQPQNLKTTTHSDYSEINLPNTNKGGVNTTERPQYTELTKNHRTDEVATKFSYVSASSYKENLNSTNVTLAQIPRPVLPLRELSAEECKKYFDGVYSKIMVDANGCIFDGYSADNENLLLPILEGYKLQPEQAGLAQHIFKFKNDTITSKNLESFMKERISNGFVKFNILRIGE